MATVFYVIGWLVIIGGAVVGGYTALGMSQAMNNVGVYGASTVFGVALASALGIVMTGLLLLAIGGVLARLDRIVYNTAN